MTTPLTRASHPEIKALQERATAQSDLYELSCKTLCTALPVIAALAAFIFLPFPLSIVVPVVLLVHSYCGLPAGSYSTYIPTPSYGRWHFSPVHAQASRGEGSVVYRRDGAHVAVGAAARR